MILCGVFFSFCSYYVMKNIWLKFARGWTFTALYAQKIGLYGKMWYFRTNKLWRADKRKPAIPIETAGFLFSLR